MYRFAWIGYFPDNEVLSKTLIYLNQIKGISTEEYNMDDILSRKTPIGPFFFDNICSKKGNSTQGFIIITPFLLKHFPILKKEEILERVFSSVDCALENGAQIICLAGVLGDFVPLMKERMKKQKVYFITGRKLLTATIIDNLMEIAKVADIDLSKTEVSIFDTHSPVARVCAQILVDKVKRVRIFDRENKDKDDFMEFKSVPSEKLKITSSIKETLKGGKFVISTYLLVSEEMIKNLESKSIFLDAIVPFWGARTIFKERKDVLSIEAAWISRGVLDYKEFDILFPKDTTVCCLAEAVMLGLEDEVDESMLKLTPENVLKMRNIGEKYDFVLPFFRCKNKIFEEAMIKEYTEV